MTMKQYEELIRQEIDRVVLKTIKNHKELDISAKSRAGAEVSDFLEEKFVEYGSESKYLKDRQYSPKGATKNPWDAKTTFHFHGHEEIIWIDFKAIKVSGKDSNPDIGTPNKVIKFIKRGYFYLLYVYVYYKESNKGLKFVKVNDNYVKSYFLKDIHHSFRRNPKNQLQVNVSQLPEYRTREEFIELLMGKISESHKRQINISNKALKTISEETEELSRINSEKESKILKILQ